MASVVTLGETLVLFEPTQTGKIENVLGLDISIGGAESNVAVGLARLGQTVIWHGRVGREGLGDKIVKTLKSESVSVAATYDDTRKTALMFKETQFQGRSRVIYYRSNSAGSLLEFDDVLRKSIKSSRLLHISGITPMLSSQAYETVMKSIEYAVKTGCVVSFDINYRSQLASYKVAANYYQKIASSCDFIFGGSDELAMLIEPNIFNYSLSDDLDAECAKRVLSWLSGAYSANIVHKRGNFGAAVYSKDKGKYFEVDGYNVPVVDTVGAGDSFVAGYLDATLRGSAPEECLIQGNKSGALTCMVRGDWEGAPTKDDLQYFDYSSKDPVNR